MAITAWTQPMRQFCYSVISTLIFFSTVDAQNIDKFNEQMSRSIGLEKVSLIVERMRHNRNNSKTEAIQLGTDALKILADRPHDHMEVQVRTILSWCESRTGNAESGLQHALRANEIAKRLDVKKDVAEAEYHIALALWYQGKAIEAIKICEQTCQAYRSLDDKSGLGKSLSLLGAIHRSRSSYHESLKCHRESLAISEQLRDSAGVARSQNNIGLIYWRIGQPDDALEFFESALLYYRESGSLCHRASILSNLGLILIELDRPDEALAHLNEGVELGEHIPRQRINAKLISNIGYAYECKDDYAKALDYYQQALAMRIELKDGWGCARSLGCIGNIEALSHHHIAAIENLQLGLAYARKCDARDEQAELNKLLADSYKALGNHKNALAALEQHFEIKEELDAAKTMKQIAELTANSKLAKQKSKVAILERAQSQQSLELSRQRSRLWVLISMVLVSTIVTIVFVQSRAMRAKKQNYNELQSTLANLQESEERYRCIFEDSVVPKFLIDPEKLSLIDLNSAAKVLYQKFCHKKADVEQPTNSTFAPFSSSWLSALYSYIDTNERFQVWRWNSPANKICFFELRTTPVWVKRRKCVLVFIQDVTENRRRDEERIRLEKMESLGVLAGGIAHDFRNALAAILGYVSIARLEVEKNSEVDYFLERAELGGDQANWLTSQLITFSKGGSPDPKVHNLEKLLIEAVDLSNFGSKAEVKIEVEQGQLEVYVDEGQFKQVISNLVINAIQAMEDCGSLFVRAKKFYAKSRLSPIAKQGNYICIEIQDSGPGIPAGIRNKVLDPYYTTKDYGSGLGLATASSIVTHHNGFMDFQCDEGNGTTFSIYFPVIDG